jgi:hypothetical protein
MIYFDYPAGTNTQIVCAAPEATTNTANCSSVVDDLSEVGSYTGAENRQPQDRDSVLPGRFPHCYLAAKAAAFGAASGMAQG